MTRTATAHGFRAFLSAMVLLIGAPALAGDVSVKLDAGTGFSIKDSTGTVERLRINEATGNISRNGALFVHTTGTNNTFVGAGAGNTSTSGPGGNSALGTNALLNDTTGFQNSAFGTGALSTNTSGNGNVAMGIEALRGNTTGLYNVAIGWGAGVNESTGSHNIYLASNANTAAESNTIRIGANGTHTRAFVAGIRLVTTGNANAIPVLIDSAGQLGTTSSSRSVKNDIRDMGDATDHLLDLRPVTFRYKQQQQTLPSGGEAPPEYGLIAEEVAEVFPDLVVYDEQGQPFTVKYHEMAPMLLNEMKKQQHTIESQQAKIEAQQKEMATLTTRLARVETRVGGAAGQTQR